MQFKMNQIHSTIEGLY